MTEAEWQASRDVEAMVKWLEFDALHLFGKRKQRLFAVACCRSVWHLLADEKGRLAVDVAEDFADNLATEEELEAVYQHAANVGGMIVPFAETLDPPTECLDALTALCFAAEAASGTACSFVMADYVADRVSDALRIAADVPPETIPELLAAAAPQMEEIAEFAAPYARVSWRSGISAEAEVTRQCHLLRDIFGNPFRPVVLDRSLVSEEAIAVARAIYEERAFERLPLLADMLEEAGIMDAEILSHCRGPGIHTRGCHVLDWILGNDEA